MKGFRVSAVLVSIAVVLLFELGCGDQYRPVANPISGPGGQPQATHYAFVVNNNQSGSGSSTQIDVSGDTVLNLRTAGLGSVYEAFGVGEFYVANQNDDSVTEYSLILSTNPTTINLLPGSHPVALVSTSSSSMYVLNSGANSACPTTGSISTISASTLTVQYTICVGVNPVAMVQQPSNGNIYILNAGDNSISVFNPPSQVVTATITSAAGLGANAKALAMSLDGAVVYVVTQGTSGPGALNIIATSNNSIAPAVPLGVSPTFAYVDQHLNRLFVTNTGDNTVSIFDSSNVNFANNPPIPLLKQVTVGSSPVGVVALLNGTRFYVANSGDNTVSVISSSSFAPITVVPVQQTPTSIAADPGSSKVYVINQGSSSTSIIQTSNNTVVKNLAAPQQDPNCTTGCALQQPMMVITE